MLCSHVLKEQRRRHAMSFCMPLHVSMLLLWCDVSSITPGSLRHAPCGLIVGVMRVPRNTRMKHACLQTVMTKRIQCLLLLLLLLP